MKTRMLSLSLLAGLFMGWGVASHAAPFSCLPPVPSSPIGPGGVKSLTYTATDSCEGYEFDLLVPPAGGSFFLSLTVLSGPAPLRLLQIFNDSADIYAHFVNGTQEAWSSESPGLPPHYYYQFADPSLFGTPATYSIEFRTVADDSRPYGPRATVRLGGSAVIAAIPLPASALLLAAGIAALGWRARAAA